MSGTGERFLSAIHSDKLMSGIADHATAKKPTIVGFIIDNVLISPWRVRPVARSCVMQPSIWKNPEDEFRRAVRKIAKCFPAPAIFPLGAVGEYGFHNFPEELVGPAVFEAMVIGDKVAAFGINFDDLVRVDITASHFT